ncbi:MAG: maleylpyruvate isomerase family mycothiol-dependent enzyme [Streptosporangiaceae bacterium]
MDVCAYVDALEHAGSLMATAARSAGPDAAVPTCPGWTVRDLVRHTGGVHRWATRIVGDPRTAPWKDDLELISGGWPADPDLPDWLAAGQADLARVLRAADPGLRCWAFLAAPSPLAMWARRQAQETCVHRADAELAAGRSITPIAPEFAADGIDELLTGFITRLGGALRSPVPHLLGVRCTDTDGQWLVRIGPDDPVASSGPAANAEADCQVSGPAADLYLALWNRDATGRLAIDGDPDVLDMFRGGLRVRWT